MLWKFWTDFIALILRRPSHYQVAALCWRIRETAGEAPADTGTGIEVLLISSLTTGRWILPKGWPQTGRDGAGTALEEAWEEAGIRIDDPRPQLVGRYRYRKRLSGDVPAPTMVDVWAIRTGRLLDSYPEAGRRKREWFTPEEAAGLVDEPELASLLRNSAALISPN